MELIFPQQILNLTLGRDLSVHLKRGHPWVFRDALSKDVSAKKISFAKLSDKKGEFLAWGIYHPEGPLALRVLDLDHRSVKPDSWQKIVQEKFQLARQIRSHLAASLTSGYRLINGEGDGLPGLVCDVYDRYAVIKLDGVGMEQFWNLKAWAQLLTSELQLTGVFSKARDKNLNHILLGDIPEDIIFLENGAKFSVNVHAGSKTGFFLDQRDNRHFIGSIAFKKNVLNVFSYTGGFSIYAGRGGAKHVTSVDIASEAIKVAEHNWTLNGLDPQKHLGVAQDAFAFVDEALKNKKHYDLIIVDPPSFAPSAQTLEAGAEAYVKIFSKAIKLLSPNGIIAFSSCSSHVDFSLFLEICQRALSKSQTRGQVLRLSGQGIDHPFPLAAPELRYLKFAVYRII